MIRETENLSMNSLISRRIRVSGVENRSCASTLTSSVFPTPVGPAKIKETGLRFGDTPVRLRRIARARQLISIAHPDFRDELLFEAKKRGIMV